MEKLELLMKRIDKFNKDRDWDQFHSPSNLAKSISIEAAELLECFQWNNENYDIENVKEELADVMVMLKQFQYYYGITDEEITEIMNYKIERQLDRIKEGEE